MSVVIFILGGTVLAGVSAGVSDSGAHPAATKAAAVSAARAGVMSDLAFMFDSFYRRPLWEA